VRPCGVNAAIRLWAGWSLAKGRLMRRFVERAAVGRRSELRSEDGFGLGVAIKSPPWSRSIRESSPGVTEPLLERGRLVMPIEA
jgi:hypothetical protein